MSTKTYDRSSAPKLEESPLVIDEQLIVMVALRKYEEFLTECSTEYAEAERLVMASTIEQLKLLGVVFNTFHVEA